MTSTPPHLTIADPKSPTNNIPPLDALHSILNQQRPLPSHLYPRILPQSIRQSNPPPLTAVHLQLQRQSPHRRRHTV